MHLPAGSIATLNAPGFPAARRSARLRPRRRGEGARARPRRQKSAAVAAGVSHRPRRAGRSGSAGRLRRRHRGRRGRSHTWSARGPGCYVATVAVRAPRSVSVTLAGRLERRFVFALPRAWPPPRPPPSSRNRAGCGETSQRSSRTSGSPPIGATHHTRYRMAAPDRFAYQIAGGPAGIILGSRRWDRSSPTAPWRRSSQQPPLRQPAPFWRSVRDARVVASPRRRGRSAWRITFFDPTTPAWFEVLLDKQTMRTLELWMVTTSHSMRERLRTASTGHCRCALLADRTERPLVGAFRCATRSPGAPGADQP